MQWLKAIDELQSIKNRWSKQKSNGKGRAENPRKILDIYTLLSRIFENEPRHERAMLR